MLKKLDNEKEGQDFGVNIPGMGTVFSKLRGKIVHKLELGVSTLFENWLRYCTLRKQDISETLVSKIDNALKLNYLTDDLASGARQDPKKNAIDHFRATLLNNAMRNASNYPVEQGGLTNNGAANTSNGNSPNKSIYARQTSSGNNRGSLSKKSFQAFIF